MAGSGAALRLHEFRERQDASSAEPWTPSSDQALRPSSHQAEKEEVYKRSYDLQVLRLLEIQRHSQAPQRPPETSYQHHYGLQAPLVPQQNHTVSPTHRPFTSDSM
ncbi:unnamed protein product [Arctogadus glacialis]